MRYKPTLRVGGSYQRENGTTVTIGHVSGISQRQYRAAPGDKDWWFGDGTHWSGSGNLIAPADVAAPINPIDGPVVQPGNLVITTTIDLATLKSTTTVTRAP